jgi:hypothetical protein
MSGASSIFSPLSSLPEGTTDGVGRLLPPCGLPSTLGDPAECLLD